MSIKIKPEYANVVFGFNNKSLPLGQRDDLHLLLKDAKHHKDYKIIDMFEGQPDENTDKKILDDQERIFNEKQAQKSTIKKEKEKSE